MTLLRPLRYRRLTGLAVWCYIALLALSAAAHSCAAPAIPGDRHVLTASAPAPAAPSTGHACPACATQRELEHALLLTGGHTVASTAILAPPPAASPVPVRRPPLRIPSRGPPAS